MIVLCLLVSLVSPAAFAVDAGADSVTAAEQSSEANNTASKEISNGSDLIVTGENAANYGMPSLRGQETAGTVSETEILRRPVPGPRLPPWSPAAPSASR